MSIFVDPNALFPIEVRFVVNKNKQDQTVGVKILKESDKKQSGEIKIVCEARGRDYDTMSLILEETTIINHISAKPMLRSKLFRAMIIEKFFVRWNIQDSENKMVPINKKTINNMFYSLVKELTSEWLRQTKS